ncbi:MAG TPA: glucuronyl hydrolase [Nitrosospira sp.]|nr:glucuronyl hydrolase [Nitrosospira sp.]
MQSLEGKAGSVDMPLLSCEELMRALELMIRRMDIIDSGCAGGFPLYSPGNAGQWVTSAGGSWVGGFWGGWWWLRSRITGAAPDRRRASDICGRLSSKIGADSINRSLIFWYGASLGDLWFGDTGARELARQAAAAIAASYDAKMNCIPLGTGMGGGSEGNQRVTMDTLAALIQLLDRNGHAAHRHMVRRHADTLLAACRTQSGAFHAGARFHDGGFRPADRAGAWSRGQAWAMLGLTRAAARWGEPYLAHARSACEYWKHSRPASFPLDRLDKPAPRDPSSAVIASLAMLSLAALTTDGDRWHEAAWRQVTAVIRSRYFTGFAGNDEHAGCGGEPAPGIFRGCCYETHPGRNELVESAWGSFFLMATISALAGICEPNHC